MKKLYAIAFLLLISFTVQAQLDNDGFYRVRNVANAEDYLSLSNDILNYTVIVDKAAGGFTNLTGSDGQNRAMECARLYMKTDIHVVEDEDCIAPSTIMYINKASKGQYDLIGQSTSLIKLTTGKVVHPTVTATFENIYAHISKVSGSGALSKYTAYVTLTGTVTGYKEVFGIQIPINQTQSLGDRYLVDNDKTFDIASSGNATNAQWYIEPVTSFNVKPEVEFNGKFYTTLHVPYAFQLSGQVEKAYAVLAIATDGKVEIGEAIASTGEMVPAGTPVILECNSAFAADCQLVPVGEPRIDKDTAYEGNNLLKGNYFCNQDGIQTYPTSSGTGTFNADNYTQPTNPQKYVLGITASGKLGFVKPDETVTAMPANKAWLEYTGSAEELVLTIEAETTLAGDVNRDGTQTIADVTALVNIILGKATPEANPEYDFEAANVNGEDDITIADVTALVNIILGKE